MEAVILPAMVQIAEEIVVLERRAVPRRLRDAQNPFELPEEVFVNLFRVSRVLAQDLCITLRPQLQRRKNDGLSVECQVLTAIRFFAVGSYQRCIGRDWGLAVSQPSVSRCVRDVSLAVSQLLLIDWVKFPATVEERARAKRTFSAEIDPLHGAIGAVDCTHVAIRRPYLHEENYFNHHGYHSMNVQLVCDSNLKVIDIDARFGGARHDAFIWSSGGARLIMQLWYDRGERGTWLIGDSGYPLEPWLLTPLPNAAPGTAEFRYTEAICRARNPVERCFGVLKTVWRCLLRERVLMYSPQKAGRIINTCVVLHNMRLHYNLDPLEEPHVADNARPMQLPEPAEEPPQGRLAEGRRAQTSLIRRKFQ